MRRLSLSHKPHSRSSGLWLATTALVSSCLAFMFALLTAWYLNIPVNPVLMGEALPFLVITVGFEKPFVLTRAVFSHPGIGPTGGFNGRGALTPGSESSVTSPRKGTADSPQSNRHLRRLSITSDGFSPRIGYRFTPPIPAREIVLSAIAKAGIPIVRDYVIEVAVLFVGAMSGVAGLKEFCLLAAVILVYDCIMLMGFYVAVLTVMVEVSAL